VDLVNIPQVEVQVSTAEILTMEPQTHHVECHEVEIPEGDGTIRVEASDPTVLAEAKAMSISASVPGSAPETPACTPRADTFFAAAHWETDTSAWAVSVEAAANRMPFERVVHEIHADALRAYGGLEQAPSGGMLQTLDTEGLVVVEADTKAATHGWHHMHRAKEPVCEGLGRVGAGSSSPHADARMGAFSFIDLVKGEFCMLGKVNTRRAKGSYPIRLSSAP